jgi:hypothetical protein
VLCRLLATIITERQQKLESIVPRFGLPVETNALVWIGLDVSHCPLHLLD